MLAFGSARRKSIEYRGRRRSPLPRCITPVYRIHIATHSTPICTPKLPFALGQCPSPRSPTPGTILPPLPSALPAPFIHFGLQHHQNITPLLSYRPAPAASSSAFVASFVFRSHPACRLRHAQARLMIVHFASSIRSNSPAFGRPHSRALPPLYQNFLDAIADRMRV
jgi:hypothetical protein